MSAFFLAINRNKTPFSSLVAQQMMGELDVFGEDQHQLVVNDYYALGYQSLWTVPEEVGESQPLLFKSVDTWFMFDGRIDNRLELVKRLASTEQTHLINESVSEPLSDAQLLIRFYLSFGQEKLSEVIGPFSFVVFEPKKGRVFAARDGMGGRNLVFRICDDFILISTYEMALVAHPSMDYRFNHARIARIIARMLEDTLSSTIEGLMPLHPGQMMTINNVANGEHVFDYFYQFDGKKRIILDSDQAYAARFKELLQQAVERRTRTIGPVGTMLSGGFDSVPISILLAQTLAKQDEKLIAFSWVFDVHKSIDERLYSTEVCQRFDIEQICINCDELWPQFDDTTYINPIIPFSTPYAELQQAILSSAQKKGVRTVMSGVHGDLLYGNTEAVLWELFKARRWIDCLREAKHRLRESSNVSQWFKQYILKPLPFVARALERRRLKTAPSSDLLTSNALAFLKNQQGRADQQSRNSLRPRGHKMVFGGYASEDICYGRHIDAKYNVDRRYPFRDRDLCEFMLSIPSEQLKFQSVERPIVRRAFKDELSSQMLTRKAKTTFYPLIEAGVKKDTQCLKWFNEPGHNWQFYVKKCYFGCETGKKADSDIVQWQCGYYNYWMSVWYSEAIIKFGSNNEQA